MTFSHKNNWQRNFGLQHGGNLWCGEWRVGMGISKMNFLLEINEWLTQNLEDIIVNSVYQRTTLSTERVHAAFVEIIV